MTFKLPHTKKLDKPFGYRFVTTPVDNLDLFNGLTLFVGKDIGKLRTAAAEVFMESKNNHLAVLTDNVPWAESLVDSPAGKAFAHTFESNYWKMPHPWNNYSEFDPYGAIFRMRPSEVVVDNADSRVLWFPWEMLAKGHGLSVLVDESRWSESLPNGFDLDDVWKLVQKNITAANSLQWFFKEQESFRIARLTDDGSFEYQIVTPEPTGEVVDSSLPRVHEAALALSRTLDEADSAVSSAESAQSLRTALDAFLKSLPESGKK